MENRKIFIDTHVHTQHSELDGMCRIDDYIEYGKNNDFPALFISDHGNISGWIPFYTACKENNIKPILGSEFYFSEGLINNDYTDVLDKNERAEKENKLNFHICLYAKNLTGYKNIIKLTTYANLENFYVKPRITMEILKKYSSGIICTTACVGSVFAHYILKGNTDKAVEYIKEFKDLFKDDFYIEYGYHGFDSEKTYVPALRRIAKDLDIKTIIGNDSHYIYKEDEFAHKVLMCKGSQTLLEDSKFNYSENYYKSYTDICTAFADFGGISVDECMKNTFGIIDKVEDYDIKFGEYVYPHYPDTEGLSQHDYLIKKIEKGLKNKCKQVTPEVKKRLDYELGVIEKMNFSGYFNVVSDYIQWAKTNGIPVGVGRGSGAGSLVNYLIDITDVNPMDYGLIFERFLNPSRLNMPDIDSDVATLDRPKVIEYLTNKYGQKGCVPISTRGYLKGKSSIKAVSSRMGLDFNKYNNLLSPIKDPKLDTVQKILDSSEQLSDLYKNDSEFKKVIDVAKKLEGSIQSISVHASAIVLENSDISDYIPIIRTKNGYATGWTDKIVEKMGLIKYDILGLSNLSVIDECCKLIGNNFDIKNIPLDDGKTFKDLQNGDNLGKFQIESQGMKSLLKRLKPENIEHISAILALYRPASMQFIDDYIANKNNPDNIKYFDDRVEPILYNTYGQMLYQEQVMNIARTLAGYTMAEADSLRKAISKKIMSEMMKHQDKFISGCIKNGMETSKAETLFDQIVEFANYSFNLSHSVSYSYITYQTAYLKSNYPIEFMTALLNQNADDIEKVGLYVNECMRLGVDILPPDINESMDKFSIDSNNKIRFGLNAIKGLGQSAITDILKHRKTPYKNIEDFVKRTKKVNKSGLQALLRVGAFESIDKTSSKWDAMAEYLSDVKKDNVYPDNIPNAVYNRIAEKEYKTDLSYDLLVKEKRELKTTKADLLKRAEINNKLQELKDKYYKNICERFCFINNYTREDKKNNELELLGFSITTHPYKRWYKFEKYFTPNNCKNKLDFISIDNALEMASLLIDGNTLFHTVAIVSGIKKIKTKKTKEEMAIITLEYFNTKINCTLFPKEWNKIKNDINIYEMYSIVAKIENAYNYGKVQDVEPYTLKAFNFRKLNVLNNADNKLILKVDDNNMDDTIRIIKQVSYKDRENWKPINKSVFLQKDNKFLPLSGFVWINDSKDVLERL